VNKYPISDEEVAQYVQAYSQPGALRGGFNYYRAAADEDPPQWQADADRQLSTPFLFLFGARRVRTAEAMVRARWRTSGGPYSPMPGRSMWGLMDTFSSGSARGGQSRTAGVSGAEAVNLGRLHLHCARASLSPWRRLSPG